MHSSSKSMVEVRVVSSTNMERRGHILTHFEKIQRPLMQIGSTPVLPTPTPSLPFSYPPLLKGRQMINPSSRGLIIGGSLEIVECCWAR